MSYLALDWGLKKIGVATADPEGRVITPRAVIFRKNSPQIWSLGSEDKIFLKKLQAEYEVTVIVLGNPLRAGKAPEAALRAYKNFCDKLFTLLQIPVECEDETLSSWEAKKMSPDAKNEDSVAAAIILKSFLSRRTRI
jgi:putative transcription antitermination factor YqgF